MTPLEKLDEAIRVFANEVNDQGTVAGWALSYETSWIQSEDEGTLPLVYEINYTLGAATSMATAAGLGRAITAIAEQNILRSINMEDDE